MEFIADVMLGRLARWLRLLGFDTFYSNRVSDAALLKIAKAENRLVLTRDTYFHHFKNFKSYLFINSNETVTQFIEVINFFGIKEFEPSRCVKCNGALSDIIDKNEVNNIVPEYIYIKNNKFFRCKECGSVYWQGSHVKRFREKVCQMLKNVK
jgi:uncharacterized protein with PIN domain